MLCRFALVANQPYDMLLGLDHRTLITMMHAHEAIVAEEQGR